MMKAEVLWIIIQKKQCFIKSRSRCIFNENGLKISEFRFSGELEDCFISNAENSIASSSKMLLKLISIKAIDFIMKFQ